MQPVPKSSMSYRVLDARMFVEWIERIMKELDEPPQLAIEDVVPTEDEDGALPSLWASLLRDHDLNGRT